MRTWWLCLLLAAAAALAIDAFLPELASGLAYLPMLLVCGRQSRRRTLVGVTALATLLAVAGLALTVLTQGASFSGHALLMRLLAILVLWCCAAMLFLQLTTHRDEEKARGELELRVWERTAVLAQTIEALQKEVNERRQIEQALRDSEQRTRQAERLAAIGQMVAGLAHESRNALQLSQACLDMLRLKLGDRPDLVPLVADIQKAQDHLQHLYDELRNYASPRKLNREAADLRRIIDQTWVELAHLAHGRELRLEHNAVSVSLVCRVDVRAFGQVIRNILENSLHACGNPVEIKVNWTEVELHGRPALQIAVRDNGPGLTAEARQKLFEPFFTTKSQGLGLGMAIAKRIVFAHDGIIAVGPGPGPLATSLPVGEERNEGTEIVITLPR
jgi:C4-dicarboxylate-specific signal transduction histidine kinase